MDKSQVQLLELLRLGLWGGEPDTSLFVIEETNWAEILQLAKKQTVLGVISVAIEKLPASLRPERTDLLRLHQMVTLNRQYRSHHVKVLGKVIELLREIGVNKPVLLKGLGVGLNYLDPTLRQCGDIDLYVGREHYKKVCDFFISKLNLSEDCNETDKHYHFHFMDTTIEIHQYAVSPNSVVFRSRDFVKWQSSQLEGDSLRKVSIDGVEVYLPPYNFDFIYIFYHFWLHFLSKGIGLRHICDWSCYINKLSDKLDKNELKDIISLYGLAKPISLFSAIAVECLGLDATKMPNYQKISDVTRQRILDKVWKGGNFGFYRREHKRRKTTVLGRKIASAGGLFNDMLFMFRIDPYYSLRVYPRKFYNGFKAAFLNINKLRDRI